MAGMQPVTNRLSAISGGSDYEPGLLQIEAPEYSISARFQRMDVDRYDINGAETQVISSARVGNTGQDSDTWLTAC